MSTKINDGGLVHPQPFIYESAGKGQYGQYTTSNDIGHGGMTLRAWFAGLAMQGWYASMEPGTPISDVHLEVVAEFFTKSADALIAELEKGTG